jgi:hypothetical protein
VSVVAKKRVVGTSTPDKIRQKLAAGDPVAALALAKRHVEHSPADPEAIHLLRTAVTAVADQHLNAGRVTALAQLLADVDVGLFTDADWLRQLATWHAKAGNSVRALALADQVGDAALRSQVAGHAADAAVRARSKELLPADLHAGYAAVVDGFDKYKLGHDNAARERLNDIGLSSPFLEWKLLLRGFLAFTANDDEGAKANWSRLSPDRLPAKLAAPYRARIDPTAPQTGGGDQMPVDPSSLAGRLKAVQANIGKGRNLGPAFKALEGALPYVKTKLPAAVPRLANVMYHAIGRVGQPDDLARYRKLFGAPADDPEFHKLQGRVLEEIGELRSSLQNWAIYDGWLSGPPASWPEPLARRARALLQHRMADIARDIGDEAEASPFDDFFGFFSSPKRGAKPPREKPPDPVAYLRKAVELAPDWEAPAVELYEAYHEAGKPADAEAVARAFLARAPGSVPMLTRLAEGLARAGRAADALDLRRKALAANPLDRSNRVMFGYAAVGAARRLAIDGKLADAEALLAAEAEVCEAEVPVAARALRSVIARKAGRKEDAETLAEAAVAAPGGRAAARLFLHATGVLVKLKPAEKSAASKALTAALAETATPLEANLLYAAWDQFFLEGLTYTGQKTQEKKIHGVILAAAGGAGEEFDFENLGRVVEARHEWKLLGKLAEALAKRFKTNPVFPLLQAEAETGGGGRAVRPYKLTKWLTDAKRLAAASPHERHKQLLPRIDDLLKANNPFGMPFDLFD